MAQLWRGLALLPLLFVYGNCHFIIPGFGNPLLGFKNNGGLSFGGGQMVDGNGGPSCGEDGSDATTHTLVVDAKKGLIDKPQTVSMSNSRPAVQTVSESNSKPAVETPSTTNTQPGVQTPSTTNSQPAATNSQPAVQTPPTTNSQPVQTPSTTNSQPAVNGASNSNSQPAVPTAPTSNSQVAATGGNVKAPTTFKGSWELFVENSGVSAMHVVLLPLVNQVLMFDATIWKISYLKLPGPPCRPVGNGEEDCFAHSALMDVETGKLRPMRVEHDTWCSSGALDVFGRVVSTGGYNNGSDTVRVLDPCPTCDWQEYLGALGNGRWYSTQVTLSDGRFIVFGGRGMRTYEFVPPQGIKNTLKDVYEFKFLVETQDPDENNLYPFVYLSTDGNLFVFANNRSILLDYNTHRVIHEFPVLPNGARNYPASGCSCLLPIVLKPNEDQAIIPAEVFVCGGAAHDAFFKAERLRPKVFEPANKDCGRIDITDRNSKWKITNMPSPRVIGDMAVLPTGDVLIVNGAKTGSAGWDDAREPNFNPVLYNFEGDETDSKYTELAPSNIPRMYHSTYVLLPDSKVLIAGSNTNDGYIKETLFPTEVRVEKFSPHYLDPNLAHFRLDIVVEKSVNKIKYGQKFNVQLLQNGGIDQTKLQVTIYSPPFTTHGISMNQRLIQLGIDGFNTGNIALTAPSNGNIAPPGYYMLYVNYNGVPCKRAMWIQITP